MEGFIVCLKNREKINFFDTRLFLACKNKKKYGTQNDCSSEKKNADIKIFCLLRKKIKKGKNTTSTMIENKKRERKIKKAPFSAMRNEFE
jgi:hypothetical protein